MVAIAAISLTAIAEWDGVNECTALLMYRFAAVLMMGKEKPDVQ